MLVMVYLLIIILIIGYIDLAVALGFLITYAIYVTLVFFQSKIISDGGSNYGSKSIIIPIYSFLYFF